MKIVANEIVKKILGHFCIKCKYILNPRRIE
jgi:hypothetical protein